MDRNNGVRVANSCKHHGHAVLLVSSGPTLQLFLFIDLKRDVLLAHNALLASILDRQWLDAGKI